MLRWQRGARRLGLGPGLGPTGRPATCSTGPRPPLRARTGAPGAPMRVAVVHPDLGLGGAERLVVDACSELARRGHVVEIYTPHFDEHRCFPECGTGAFTITRAGGWFPRTILGRCQALCTYVRCVLAALAVLLSSRRYDVAFADSVSAVVPVLQWKMRVLFYCHYPDKLLQRTTAGTLRQLYRAPIDAIERWSTRRADAVAVNSKFTADAYRRVFDARAKPAVFYPPAPDASTPPSHSARAERPVLLSINRFEGKKNLPLALEALRLLRNAAEGVPGVAAGRARRAVLVFAGGCDARVPENAEQLSGLRVRASRAGLQSNTVHAERVNGAKEAAAAVSAAVASEGDDVVFFPSCSDDVKHALLAACTCLVYTPSDEHFGIAPLEAAMASRPTVACASGGPLETIAHGDTGLLCDDCDSREHAIPPSSTSQDFRALAARVEDGTLAGVFARALACTLDADAASSMGARAKARCIANFSRDAFGSRLEAALVAMM